MPQGWDMSIFLGSVAAARRSGRGRQTHRHPRSRRWKLITAAQLASVVLVLAGCSSSGPATPTQISDYHVVCAKKKPIAEAAAYSGSGPHPIAFFNYPKTSAGIDDGTLLGTAAAGTEAPSSWYTTDVAKLQLVACIEQAKTSKTHDCGTYSQYKTGQGGAATDVLVQWYSYTISLYQAKTGTLVTAPVTLVGEAETTCPQNVSLLGNDTSPYVQQTELTIDQIQQALDKYVS